MKDTGRMISLVQVNKGAHPLCHCYCRQCCIRSISCQNLRCCNTVNNSFMTPWCRDTVISPSPTSICTCSNCDVILYPFQCFVKLAYSFALNCRLVRWIQGFLFFFVRTPIAACLVWCWRLMLMSILKSRSPYCIVPWPKGRLGSSAS